MVQMDPSGSIKGLFIFLCEYFGGFPSFLLLLGFCLAFRVPLTYESKIQQVLLFWLVLTNQVMLQWESEVIFCETFSELPQKNA